MTGTEIFNKMADHQDDYEFVYKEKTGAVCIFDDKVIIGYNGNEIVLNSLQEAMDTPFLDGKSLNEVADEIELYG